MSIPNCDNCGDLATCLAKDGMHSCDHCCGHNNGEGQCKPINQMNPEPTPNLDAEFDLPHMSNPTDDAGEKLKPSGIELIQAERKRQIEIEGYTVEHDSQYKHGILLAAGQAYETAANHQIATGKPLDDYVPRSWPWPHQWWKPFGGPVRLLVKAGALYQAAEDYNFAKGLFCNGESRTPSHLVTIPHIERVARLIDSLNTRVPDAPTSLDGPSECSDAIPPNIEIEALKAQLVLAVASLQAYEIWALRSPFADLKNPPPSSGVDMDSLPQDLQARIIKARKTYYGIE